MAFLYLLLLLTQFWTIFGGFGQIQKSKMADQDGRHSEMITQLLRHVTSSPRDADAKGAILRRTIYLPSLVVIALLFSELRGSGGGGDQKKPGPNKVKHIESLIPINLLRLFG